MSKTHNKVLVIVEETVHHAYLLDPDSPETLVAVNQLAALASGTHLEHIPMAWDRPDGVFGGRIKKLPLMPRITLREIESQLAAKHSSLTNLTVVIPDQDGYPSEERKFNSKTFSIKPLKRKK